MEWVQFDGLRSFADRVEHILPKLLEAARAVPEPAKEMTPVAAEKM